MPVDSTACKSGAARWCTGYRDGTKLQQKRQAHIAAPPVTEEPERATLLACSRGLVLPEVPSGWGRIVASLGSDCCQRSRPHVQGCGKGGARGWARAGLSVPLGRVVSYDTVYTATLASPKHPIAPRNIRVQEAQHPGTRTLAKENIIMCRTTLGCSFLYLLLNNVDRTSLGAVCVCMG